MALFYILDTRQIIGNEALWWGPNRSGYTTNLDAAGQYDENQTKGLRSTDIPVPVEVAKRLAHASVFSDLLASEGFKKPREKRQPCRCGGCSRFVSQEVWLCRKCEDAEVYR